VAAVGHESTTALAVVAAINLVLDRVPQKGAAVALDALGRTDEAAALRERYGLTQAPRPL
jgi:hypothetical protein